ncbi:hypothetical protein E5288_WYG005908 [Bos mutus]|uniref:Uncharacterized protein n=1 Tax=Bos mutus TaxID=72004 RepID=A0A6B0QV26_9CETA|nr:hypothetical protein [Bos mutus]
MQGLAALRTRSLQSALLVPERPAAHFGTGAPRKHPGGKAFKVFSWDEHLSQSPADRPRGRGGLADCPAFVDQRRLNSEPASAPLAGSPLPS